MASIERDEPRISLNQLTEYLVATAARRKRIIEQQKRPNDFQVIYYQDAQDAIQRFIAGGMADEDELGGAIEAVLTRKSSSDYDEIRSTSNAEAMESFLEVYEAVDLLELNPSQGPNDQQKLRISGLDLSVRPEIILRGELKRHGPVVGGIKLYFTKRETARLGADSGKYPSSLLHEYLRDQNPDKKVLHGACIVVDVFGQSVFRAPRSHKRALSDVAVACEEISLWWNTL
jgi:hypothetical protein